MRRRQREVDVSTLASLLPYYLQYSAPKQRDIPFKLDMCVTCGAPAWQSGGVLANIIILIGYVTE